MTARRGGRSRPRGYLLVEAVIGIAFSGIVIAGIMSMGQALETAREGQQRRRLHDAALALALELAPDRNPGRWGPEPVCGDLEVPGAPKWTSARWCFLLKSGNPTLEVQVVDDEGGEVKSAFEVRP